MTCFHSIIDDIDRCISNLQNNLKNLLNFLSVLNLDFDSQKLPSRSRMFNVLCSRDVTHIYCTLFNIIECFWYEE